MTARRVVAVLLAVLAVYAALVASHGILLLQDPRPVVEALGVGVLLLPLVAIVLVTHEVRFGRSAERVATRAAREQHAGSVGEDEEPLPRRPSGRIDRRAADAVFERRRAEVEAAPDDWRAWVGLARAYGDAGDTSRGRRAMRRAIELERASR